MNDELNATQGAIDLAEELGLDLNDIQGSGDGGRVYKTDVEEVLADGVGSRPPEVEEYSGAELKSIVRVISRTGQNRAGENAFPVMQIDAYVASWINEGYDLFATHYLGELPEGYMMMYILLRK